MSLYTELNAAGLILGNHYSDMYVKACAESLAIIKAHGVMFSTYKDNITGRREYEVPLAFEPYWLARQ